MNTKVLVIGAGLAGCEAAYQLLKRGYNVELYEMRPIKMTDAHTTDHFAELICSNSFRANSIENAVGLLKEEMRLIDSIIIKAADYAKVEAGGALAVDREIFSDYIYKTLASYPNLTVIRKEIRKIPSGPIIIATGPLTSPAFSDEIKHKLGDKYLYFFDAIAPIVTYDSINLDKVFLASRYNKGEAAYLNCPMNELEFNRFYDFLVNADAVVPHDFELKIFEGCMPIEDMAKRGRQTLLFGPMKPVGLDDPRTGRWPYAVVQLRQDNRAKTLYNLVGFQTHLKFKEQQKLLSLIPGLEHAQIVRYGVMHRNTYIHSPSLLNKGYQLINDANIFFAGQMTGVEGYVESAASGMIAGINMARYLKGLDILDLDQTTAIGALSCYISNPTNQRFDPMNVNFGIFDPLKERTIKKERKMAYSQRALTKIKEIIMQME